MTNDATPRGESEGLTLAPSFALLCDLGQVPGLSGLLCRYDHMALSGWGADVKIKLRLSDFSSLLDASISHGSTNFMTNVAGT